MGTTTAGLEGVIAGESEICYIDGYQGILSYRGYNIHTLADNATFEETIFLLWKGWLPKQEELDQLKKELVSERELPGPVTEFLKSAPKANTMDVLRTAVSLLSLYDPEAQDMSAEANQRKAARLMAKTATIVTSYERLRNNKEVISGDPNLSFAANFLYTMSGNKPDEVMEHAFNVALVLHADHELNASTFAARVIAATLSDIYSCVTGGIGALKGPLHGGANQDVIKWLLDLGDEHEAEQRVKDKLAAKVKIPGFGHRVYRTEDPRATHLRVMSEELGKRTGHEKLYRLSRTMENTVMAEKHLNPNVDFYSASTYYSLSIPVDLFTPIFAVSRMAGWTAHVLEQYHNNRLIRPRAEYKGKADGQQWIALNER
ncbi:MAG TPA: citrate synthase [Bryobacteraceae bacterium]|jgi:citrate synthase|nr:citrate synthase [Bryobacteraceae bacterium]